VNLQALTKNTGWDDSSDEEIIIDG